MKIYKISRTSVLIALSLNIALCSVPAKAGLVKGVLAGAATGVAVRHFMPKQADEVVQSSSVSAPQSGMVEVGFSPEGGGEALVLKAISAAQKSLLVSAYSFTSANVTSALIAAKRKGVDVRVVADQKNNLEEDKSGKGRAALSSLRNSGIPTRVISVYPIHHDKFIVIDRTHVQTGSFNYSSSAARLNSENVIVIWNNPEIANAYLDHWVDRFNKGHDLPAGR